MQDNVHLFSARKSSKRLIYRRNKLLSTDGFEGFMENYDRKKEILDACLDTFIKNGLSETTVWDLSSSLNLQSGGIYYWFKDKDEAVVACAEEAAIRIETVLIFPALDDIKNPSLLMDKLQRCADEHRPMMKFFASVCASPKFAGKMTPVRDRLAERYIKYMLQSLQQSFIALPRKWHLMFA